MQAWENAEVNTSTPLKNEPSSEGSLKEKPKFTYQDLTDKEVQRCTGFKSKYLMLAYIILVCNGDHQKMTMTVTSLTWLEEWFLYFELLWGRTLERYVDAEKSIDKGSFTVMRIFYAKITLVLSCRMSWPKYCKHDKDIKLRKDA